MVSHMPEPKPPKQTNRRRNAPIQTLKNPRQFKRTTKPKEHYDRKVRKVGATTYIAFGKIIPDSWEYVRIKPLDRTDTTVQVLFEKLYGEGNNAQNKATHQNHKQDT